MQKEQIDLNKFLKDRVNLSVKKRCKIGLKKTKNQLTQIMMILLMLSMGLRIK